MTIRAHFTGKPATIEQHRRPHGQAATSHASLIFINETWETSKEKKE
jgi:hypothetical protein